MKMIFAFILLFTCIHSISFAAGSQQQPGSRQGSVANITTAEEVNVWAVGNKNTSRFGVVTNKGKQQGTVINITNGHKAHLVNFGDGGEVNVGTVRRD